jgi:hypothetical protein
MEILMEDVNAKVGREGTFKQTIAIESLYESSK